MLFIVVASSFCFNYCFIKVVPIRDYTIETVKNTGLTVKITVSPYGTASVMVVRFCKTRVMRVPNKDLRRKFGKLVRHLRHDRDMTQEQLAELADLSINSISQIETGQASPSLETIVKLAKALDVEEGELFKFDRK
jgi:DNA-binding XRE family transcriptional regulator